MKKSKELRRRKAIKQDLAAQRAHATDLAMIRQGRCLISAIIDGAYPRPKENQW